MPIDVNMRRRGKNRISVPMVFVRTIVRRRSMAPVFQTVKPLMPQGRGMRGRNQEAERIGKGFSNDVRTSRTAELCGSPKPSIMTISKAHPYFFLNISANECNATAPVIVSRKVTENVGMECCNIMRAPFRQRIHPDTLRSFFTVHARSPF
jgi:hypothetical protein